MVNRALVMSGGGSKGAFELGVVDYLVNDLGLDFQVIAGVSTGSLNATMLAQGAGIVGLKSQLDQLKDVWFGISSYRDVYRKRFLGKLLILFAKSSLYDPTPLEDKIKRWVDPDRLQTSGKQLRIGAVCMETGSYRSVSQTDPRIRDWTLASSSMPLMFPPVKCDGECATDGGVRNVTPLKDSFKALKDLREYQPNEDPDEMYVILASPLEIEEEKKRWKHGVEIGKRTATILVNEVFREDLSYALAINHSVRAYERLREELCKNPALQAAVGLLGALPFEFRPPKYRVVRMFGAIPEASYSEGLEFDRVKIKTAYEAGRQAATKLLSEDEMREMLSQGAVT